MKVARQDERSQTALDDYAAQVHPGRDVTALFRPKGKERRGTAVLSFRATREELFEIELAADEEYRAVSDLIRAAVRDYLARRKTVLLQPELGNNFYVGAIALTRAAEPITAIG